MSSHVQLETRVRASHGKNIEVKGHALSTLVTMVTCHPRAVQECKRAEGEMLGTLDEVYPLFSSDEYQVRWLSKNAFTFTLLQVEKFLLT